jgi:hypothetical protein
MGEEKSGKSEAIRKGRERARDVDADAGLNDESVATMSRRASPATDAVGDVKTAYKRGGPRPWEVARAAREAKAATVKSRTRTRTPPTPAPRLGARVCPRTWWRPCARRG